MAFDTYASLAVLSVMVGNNGNTLELGRKRLVGTAIGGMVLAFGYGAWGEQLPLVVARLIAGWLRLTVGYSVCCSVVVMGWLQHDQQRGLWIPYRLFWTAFGILIALRSLRRLRLALQNLRLQHPTARLWELLAQACESLLVELDSLRRQRDLPLQAWGLERQHAAMARFAAEVGEQQQLGGSLPLQRPPQSPPPTLPVAGLHNHPSQEGVQQLTAPQLSKLATRLVVLHRIEHTLRLIEQQWQDLRPRAATPTSARCGRAAPPAAPPARTTTPAGWR